MGMVGLAIIMDLVTWSFRYKIDNETRRLKRAKRWGMLREIRKNPYWITGVKTDMR
jgi:hypothetical protein